MEGVAKNSKEMIDNILKSDDPLRELGPGISSFHRLLIMLFCLFFILCVKRMILSIFVVRGIQMKTSWSEGLRLRVRFGGQKLGFLHQKVQG